eukprot:365516-Chlamydomonas_euryale.AAC.7
MLPSIHSLWHAGHASLDPCRVALHNEHSEMSGAVVQAGRDERGVPGLVAASAHDCCGLCQENRDCNVWVSRNCNAWVSRDCNVWESSVRAGCRCLQQEDGGGAAEWSGRGAAAECIGWQRCWERCGRQQMASAACLGLWQGRLEDMQADGVTCQRCENDPAHRPPPAPDRLLAGT